MSASYQQGYERGYAAGLAGRPRPEPRKDLADADTGFQTYWLAVAEAHLDATRERQTRQAAGVS